MDCRPAKYFSNGTNLLVSKYQFPTCIIANQHNARNINHPYSERSKFPSKRQNDDLPDFHVGKLIYIKGDGDKCSGRDRYMISKIDGNWLYVKKFSGNLLRPNCYKAHRRECYVPRDNRLDPAHIVERGQFSSTSSDDEDPVRSIPQTCPSPDPEPPPEVLVTPPPPELSERPVDTKSRSPDQDADTDRSAATAIESQPRRSARVFKPTKRLAYDENWKMYDS